ncbi:hypothetical protein [Rhodococcus triatomae]|nr:hypothetical protein G419_25397 [Rhodococcus triatomae BKS 15-14]
MKNVVGIVGLFIVFALVLAWWKVILGIAVLGLVVWGGVVGFGTWSGKRRDRLNGERAARSRLAARADIQHEAYLRGEDRGVFGEFQPEKLD